jgi:cytochrome c553
MQLFAPSAASALDLHHADNVQAATVCAACHGVNGVSVADHIPNLAGQRAEYLSAQLQGFRDGSRKYDVMNAIAGPLSDADIAAVANYFSRRPGASGKAKSAMLPNIKKTNAVFPVNYKAEFTRYHTQNAAEDSQLKIYYANATALTAAAAGKALPDGSVILVEIHAAKLDSGKKPVMNGDGFFVPERLVSYVTMARDAGWGDKVPGALRNENWNYAIFAPVSKRRIEVNQAECFACHLPKSKSSYLFTWEHLAANRNEK